MGEQSSAKLSKRTLVSKHGRISLRSVEALRPGEQLWDTDLKGFVVRCWRWTKRDDASHEKAISYSVKVRVSGRQRWLTIGEHGVFTPETARHEAKRLKGMVAVGDDPTTQRDEAKQAATFGEVAARFLAEHCGLVNTNDLRAPFKVRPGTHKVRASTARGYRDILRDHVLPKLSKRRIDSITSADIGPLHTRMSETPSAANRMLRVVSVVHTWARTNRLRRPAENPTEGITQYKERRREKWLDPLETRRLVQAIADAEQGVPLDRLPAYKARREADRLKHRRSLPGAKRPGPPPANTVSIDPYSAAALRCLLLTGLRPKEALKLRRSDVSLTTGVTRLTDTKTGPRTATLSTHALELLAKVPEIEGNPYFFCGLRKGLPLASLQHAFELVEELAGLTESDVVLYTLRHNFGSMLASQRVEAYELMRAMGHKNLSTSLRYIHLAAQDVQATTSRATASLADALGAVETHSAPDGVRLKARR